MTTQPTNATLSDFATAAADPSVFTDDRREIDLTESDLLGTHTYEDVLYTGDSDVVNILTGETPTEQDRTTEQAKAFAADLGPRYVAVKQPPERAVESRSPYVGSVYFNRKITGSMEWHTVFRKAEESDAYDVDFEADYESGDLTITVRQS